MFVQIISEHAFKLFLVLKVEEHEALCIRIVKKCGISSGLCREWVMKILYTTLSGHGGFEMFNNRMVFFFNNTAILWHQKDHKERLFNDSRT